MALVAALVLSIPPLIWFAGGWYMTPDASLYLLQGWNLITGHGYTGLEDLPQTRRGPGFPALLGLLMLVFGRDVDSLVWAVRLLAILNPWLAYFLIKRFSGPLAGLLAAALIVLFGYSAMLLQALNLDAVLLSAYLLAILALLAAVEKDGSLLALLSGLLLGTAIIVKETAFASLPLGLLVALLLGWSLRGVLWHYAGVILVCLPWWAWVWSATGQVFLVGRLSNGQLYLALTALFALAIAAALLHWFGLPARLLGSARGRRWLVWGLTVGWVATITALLLKTNSDLLPPTIDGLRRYVTAYLLAETPIWPLLILAGIYVTFRAVRGELLWQFYLVVLLLQVPASTLVFLLGFNPRQYTIPQTFLLGALAVLVVELFRAAARRRTASTWLRIAVAFALISSVLVGSVFQVRELFTRSTGPAGYGPVGFLSDHSNPYVNEMGAWVSNNVPEDENVLTTQAYSQQLAFLDGSKHDWTTLDLNCETGLVAPGVSGCRLGKNVLLNPPGSAVWFQIPRWQPGSRKEDQCQAVALSRPSLLRQMEQSSSSHLMLTPDVRYPSPSGWVPYLVDSGAFEIVHAMPTSRDKNTGVLVGLTLLKRTGKPGKAVPTRMDAYTVLQLARCERQRPGVRYAEEIQSSFPHGIALDTRSVSGSKPDAEARLEARARMVIQRIYGGDGGKG
jgi:4-amino-4-deoxy-L-arabinose transferase-like glycosyltransferase